MTTYLVTTEIKTSWWLKVLRFLRVKGKLQTFKSCLEYSCFNENDILNTGNSGDLKVISRKKRNKNNKV